MLETFNGLGHFAEMQVKGGTKTPYSRSFDGLSVLSSSIKEYFMCHVLENVGVPVSLAACLGVSSRVAYRDKADIFERTCERWEQAREHIEV